jgi:5-(carboxyamino)imidazole ribonucleotide mutase
MPGDIGCHRFRAVILAAEVVSRFNAAVADKLEKNKISLKDKGKHSVEELKRGDRDLD